MAQFKSFILKGVTLATVLGAAASVQALTVTSSGVGGSPDVPGVNRVNFDDLADGATGNLNPAGLAGSLTITPNARVAQGSVGGQYAAPFLSGDNGDLFGNPIGVANQALGVDTTPYLTAGSTGATAGAAIKIAFDAPQKYLGLLWGSVDDYNNLAFYDSADNLIGTINGVQVTASANGSQAADGTVYANINSDTPFKYVVATSSQFAFEFDNLAYSTSNVSVPDGGSASMMMGAALAGIGFLARRRTSK